MNKCIVFSAAFVGMLIAPAVVQASTISVLDFDGPGLGTIDNIQSGDPTSADQAFWFPAGFEVSHPTHTIDGLLEMQANFLHAAFADIRLSVENTNPFSTQLFKVGVHNATGERWDFPDETVHFLKM